MAKKQSIASEISSALGAVAARAEQLISSKPAKKTTAPEAKPTAKRTAAAKHSKVAPKIVAPKVSKAVEVAEDVVADPAVITISQEDIAKEAYLYWEARGFQGGNPAEDWARAEEELKRRASAASV